MSQGAPTLKRVHLELGGKNPVIVFEDADFDRALDAAVFMIYSLNGERCTSSSRLLVQRSIYDRFVERVTARIAHTQGGPSARPCNRHWSADSSATPRQGHELFQSRARRKASRFEPVVRARRTRRVATTCSQHCSPMRPMRCAWHVRKSSARS